jgi:phage terminase small subunit
MAELSSREALFVANYIQGKSAVLACSEAGYSKKYAAASSHVLLTRPKIAAAIKEAQDRLKEQSEMTAEKLLKLFMDAYSSAMDWKQSTGAVRAGEMIGKLTGLIQDRLAVTVEAKPSILEAIAEGKRRVAEVQARPAPLMIDITPPANEPEPVKADAVFGD